MRQLDPLPMILTRLQPQSDEDVAVLEDRVAFVQSRRGWRFGIDAVLLARHVYAGPQLDALEIGTGVGVIPILLASWGYRGPITAIEVQLALAARAIRNVSANGLDDSIQVVIGDVRELARTHPEQRFNRVVSNPPYFGTGDGHLNPHPEKAAARHEVHLDLESLCRVIAAHLNTEGTASILYPWAKRHDLARAATAVGLEVIREHKALPEDERPARVGIFDLRFRT